MPGKTHRHWPEIESILKVFAPASDVIFTPHLAPLRRGIHTTVYALPAGRLTGGDLEKVYTAAYGKAPFVSLKGDGLPATADVWAQTDAIWRGIWRTTVC